MTATFKIGDRVVVKGLVAFGYTTDFDSTTGRSKKPVNGQRREKFERECPPFKAIVTGMAKRSTGTYWAASGGTDEEDYTQAELAPDTTFTCVRCRKSLYGSEYLSLVSQVELCTE